MDPEVSQHLHTHLRRETGHTTAEQQQQQQQQQTGDVRGDKQRPMARNRQQRSLRAMNPKSGSLVNSTGSNTR